MLNNRTTRTSDNKTMLISFIQMTINQLNYPLNEIDKKIDVSRNHECQALRKNLREFISKSANINTNTTVEELEVLFKEVESIVAEAYSIFEKYAKYTLIFQPNVAPNYEEKSTESLNIQADNFGNLDDLITDNLFEYQPVITPPASPNRNLFFSPEPYDSNLTYNLNLNEEQEQIQFSNEFMESFLKNRPNY